ncbi:hypothetical protein [Paenibacillus tengchongensis]|uniref:hypothetical protein n=1 Tax=Paenibacillus tengchongensis TaxID=2608684 RepID=UPI00124E815A|nr:hypothetical protein [Paenibacillus tengchongensis]
MAGTKMKLRRYGNELTYWVEQEIIIDKDGHPSVQGLFVRLAHPYVPGTKMLDVFLNGQHLLEGGGYEEVDETAIRLDLGVYPDGHPLGGQIVPLSPGDEIYIRTWKTEYRQGGGSGIDDLRFKRLEEEVISARTYGESEIPFQHLDDRLDYIQQKAESKTMVFVLNRVFLGIAKMEMRFPYEGQITEVYVSAMKPGADRTVFQIEKCSQADYDRSPGWMNIFSSDLIIGPGAKSSNTSAEPYAVAYPRIAMNDHFRINVAELGAGIEGVTIEVLVTV